MNRTVTVLALTTVAAIGAAGSAQAKLVTFSSPSGNIGCAGETTRGTTNFVRCDIGTRTWTAPRKPASCNFDWGQGVGLGPLRRARWLCVSDTTLGAPTKLKYGASKLIGGIRCTSLTSGMRCMNRHGYGFKVSRQKVSFFHRTVSA